MSSVVIGVILSVTLQLPPLSSDAVRDLLDVVGGQVRNFEGVLRSETSLQRSGWDALREFESRSGTLRYEPGSLMFDGVEHRAAKAGEALDGPLETVPLRYSVNPLWTGSFTKDRSGEWNAGVAFPENNASARKLLHFRADLGLWLTMGKLWNDSQTIYDKIRGASKVSVASEFLGEDGIPCYRIDAESEAGSYSLWLDPARGFAPLKIAGHVPTEPSTIFTTLGEPWNFEVDIIRLEEIDGVWVPVEGDLQIHIPNNNTHWLHHVELQDLSINHTYDVTDFFIRFPADIDVADLSSPNPFFLRQTEDYAFVNSTEIVRMAERESIASLENDLQEWIETNRTESGEAVKKPSEQTDISVVPRATETSWFNKTEILISLIVILGVATLAVARLRTKSAIGRKGG